jgi:glycosyltransferase involved in cell wall biosynthesis
MKILHYTGVYAPAWTYGGPPRSVSSLCEGLAQLGHEVTVFTTNAGLTDRADIPTDRLVERNGVRVHYFPARFNFLGLNSAALEQAVAEQAGAFDLIHITGVWQPTSRAAFRAAKKMNKPYVCSPRGALGRYSFTQKPWKKWPYYWLWEKQGLNRAAAIHYTSRMEIEECMRLGLKPKAFAVPNSIDFKVWKRDEAGAHSWRKVQGIADDEVVFLFAGRLHHKKGLDLLPEVCAALPCDKAWRVVLVGVDEDGTGAQLHREFERLGLSARFLLLGGVEAHQLAAIYSAANLFIFPSRHENFGNVAVEALACGCPVALSDQVGACHELAEFAGVAVFPRKANVWAEELTRVLTGQAVTKVPSLEQLKSRFSDIAVARAMAAEYEQLCQ